MDRKTIIIVLAVIFIIAAVIYAALASGISLKTESDKTWGQKDPATINDLYIYNSSADHVILNNSNYYYVWGYVGNKAQLFADNVVITATFYDKNGTLIGTNKTTPYKPNPIPSEGKSSFEILFIDPDNKTASYKLQISISK